MKKIIILNIVLIAFFGTYAQESAIKYSFLTESGISFSPKNATLQQTFVNGITINKQHTIGLGLGIGEVIDDESSSIVSMPIFANYRCNFLSPDRSPFINVAAGVSLHKDSPQLYSTLTAGLQFYLFSVSAGLMLQTVGENHTFRPNCVIQIGIRF
jgi:hypothetical protein